MIERCPDLEASEAIPYDTRRVPGIVFVTEPAEEVPGE
jgi:hypothetical protein